MQVFEESTDCLAVLNFIQIVQQVIAQEAYGSCCHLRVEIVRLIFS